MKVRENVLKVASFLSDKCGNFLQYLQYISWAFSLETTQGNLSIHEFWNVLVRFSLSYWVSEEKIKMWKVNERRTPKKRKKRKANDEPTDPETPRNKDLKYDREKRTRTFQNSWIDKFPWVFDENAQEMYAWLYIGMWEAHRWFGTH
jgi:hypothetical protein